MQLLGFLFSTEADYLASKNVQGFENIINSAKLALFALLALLVFL